VVYRVRVTDAPLKVGCYLARAHGLDALDALLAAPDYRVACVMTHRRGRPEHAAYAERAAVHGFPLTAVDSVHERDTLAGDLAPLDLDLLASVSWRYRITPAELALPRLGGVNLHRGRLPTFAGAEPVRRALEAGETEIVISAHVLTDVIDGGPVLATARRAIRRDPGEASAACVERLKREITPLFGPLLLDALARLRTRTS
jgi:methionyl-tRNA formyltransferase